MGVGDVRWALRAILSLPSACFSLLLRKKEYLIISVVYNAACVYSLDTEDPLNSNSAMSESAPLLKEFKMKKTLELSFFLLNLTLQIN